MTYKLLLVRHRTPFEKVEEFLREEMFFMPNNINLDLDYLSAHERLRKSLDSEISQWVDTTCREILSYSSKMLAKLVGGFLEGLYKFYCRVNLDTNLDEEQKTLLVESLENLHVFGEVFYRTNTGVGFDSLVVTFEEFTPTMSAIFLLLRDLEGFLHYCLKFSGEDKPKLPTKKFLIGAVHAMKDSEIFSRYVNSALGVLYGLAMEAEAIYAMESIDGIVTMGRAITHMKKMIPTKHLVDALGKPAVQELVDMTDRKFSGYDSNTKLLIDTVRKELEVL